MAKRKLIDANTLSDLLLLVDEQVSTDEIVTWTPEERLAVEVWSASAYLSASDNDVRVPPKPAVLGKGERQVITFFGWYSLILLALSLLVSVATIGQPRKPMTGVVTAITIVLQSPIYAYILLTLFK